MICQKNKLNVNTKFFSHINLNLGFCYQCRKKVCLKIILQTSHAFVFFKIT
jgi:hypothetical protein